VPAGVWALANARALRGSAHGHGARARPSGKPLADRLPPR